MDTSAAKIYDAMGYGALDATQTPALIGAAGKRDAAADREDRQPRAPQSGRGGRAGAAGRPLAPVPATWRRWWRSAPRPAVRRRWRRCSAVAARVCGSIVIVQHIDAAFRARHGAMAAAAVACGCAWPRR
jgi:two-component system chemotaxis response regulator CheB/two-component system response regulator WspF